ncbi:MAG TPA: SAF domain-containing protein [Actinomycetes bacterium]|jgi:hypothetical protein|nr:SAF domain-containing protein [Actinomycetes bacterium]
MPAKLPPTGRYQPSTSSAPADGWNAARARLVPLRRERKPALILAGLVLALVCGTVTAAVYLRVGGRVAVLAVARDVPVGHTVSARDLTEARISYDRSLHAIPARSRDQVTGRVAAVDLKAGSLVTPEELTTSTVPGPGQAVVGVALKAGQLPADPPRPGDPVTVVLVPSAGQGAGGATTTGRGSVLVPVARILSTRLAGANGDAGDVTVVSLIVRQDQVGAVARAQAAGQVAIALLPAGTTGARS